MYFVFYVLFEKSVCVDALLLLPINLVKVVQISDVHKTGENIFSDELVSPVKRTEWDIRIFYISPTVLITTILPFICATK